MIEIKRDSQSFRIKSLSLIHFVRDFIELASLQDHINFFIYLIRVVI